MTSRDFCYWLQGHFELQGKIEGFTKEQAEIVARHLAMVFKHEIDPSFGDQKHQEELQKVHGPRPFPDVLPEVFPPGHNYEDDIGVKINC